MIKRVLVGLGGMPYTQAVVRHAIDIAQSNDAEISAVTIVDLKRVANVGPVPVGAGAAAAELVQHRLAAAQAACRKAGDFVQAECSKAGIRCHLITEAGDPFEELCSLWRYHDVTILSLQHLFEYDVVHDPADMVVRIIGRGVRPILAVTSDFKPVKRVLVSYNGSLESAKALKQFVQLRPWPDIATRIVCFEMSVDDGMPLLREAVEYCKAHGLAAESAHVPGKVEAGLDREIEDWNADVVVMGSTAHSRIFRYVMGDTAMHMVKHSTVPLFMSQ